MKRTFTWALVIVRVILMTVVVILAINIPVEGCIPEQPYKGVSLQAQLPNDATLDRWIQKALEGRFSHKYYIQHPELCNEYMGELWWHQTYVKYYTEWIDLFNYLKEVN